MSPGLRLTTRVAYLTCLALLLAGVGGVIAVPRHHHGDGTGASVAFPGGTGATTQATAPATTTAPTTVAPVPSESELADGLIVPNDLGGYYRVIADASAPRLASSGCLAPLGRPAEALHRALEYLRGPFDGDLPVINEQLSAFASAEAATTAFGQLADALRACTSTALQLPAGRGTASLAPMTLPQLGDQAVAASGPFTGEGLRGRVLAAVVREGGTVVVFVYADRTPASLAILGSPLSTLQAAAGKASP